MCVACGSVPGHINLDYRHGSGALLVQVGCDTGAEFSVLQNERRLGAGG